MVVKKEPINMMNSQNLGIVFGVNLARSPKESCDSYDQISVGETLPLFEIMITNYPKVFSSFKRAAAVSRSQPKSFEKQESTGRRGGSLLGLSRVAKRSNTVNAPPKDISAIPKLVKSESTLTERDIDKTRKRKKRKKATMKSISMKKQDAVDAIKKQTVRQRPRRTLLLTEDYLNCYVCKEKISETSQTIFIDAQYRCHHTCFVCGMCNIPLEFGSFEIKEPHLFCTSCNSNCAENK